VITKRHNGHRRGPSSGGEGLSGYEVHLKGDYGGPRFARIQQRDACAGGNHPAALREQGCRCRCRHRLWKDASVHHTRNRKAQEDGGAAEAPPGARLCRKAAGGAATAAAAALLLSLRCCHPLSSGPSTHNKAHTQTTEQVGAVIVSPTRELARQIHTVMLPFVASLKGASCLLLVGGT